LPADVCGYKRRPAGKEELCQLEAYPADGAELVNKASSIQSPILAFGPLATGVREERTERLFQSVDRSIRCCAQHTRPRPKDQLADVRARSLDILTLVSGVAHSPEIGPRGKGRHAGCVSGQYLGARTPYGTAAGTERPSCVSRDFTTLVK
jgi:hypothetical protein